MLTFWPAPRVVPRAQLGSYGKNNLISVRVAEDEAYQTATMAQEARERERKRQTVALFTLCGALLGVLLVVFGLHWLAIPGAAALGFVAGNLWTRTATFQSGMEISGHEADVQVAHRLYGADPAWFRGHEAAGMATGYKGFIGWTPEEIRDAMIKVSPDEQAWVDRHEPYLRRWKEKHG